MSRQIKFIAAIDEKNGLAKNGVIPWDLPTDKQFFRDSISSGIGLMGWGTFVSNGKRPFPTSPRNVVITSRDVSFDGVEIIHNLDEFINNTDEDIWVIGGGNVFEQLLPKATQLYITRVSVDYGCDVFFPEFETGFELVSSSETNQENGIEFCFQIWEPTPK